MSKSLLLVLVPLAGCCATPAVPPETTAAAARETAALVRVVPLKYAVAAELSRTLDELFDAPRRSAQSPRTVVVADARTNSLVVAVDSDRPADMERVVELIARLDVDATRPASATTAGSVRVVPLRYAAATELADTLNELAEASRRGASSRESSATSVPAHDARVVALGQTRIAADARTNSLVLHVDDDRPADMARISELIAQLDVEVK